VCLDARYAVEDGAERSSNGVTGRVPRSVGEKPYAWVLGMRWRMERREVVLV
jgi:hypothetical protein